MANPQHLAILKQGVVAWNGWRRQNPSIAPDLIGVMLEHPNLERIDLTGTNLAGAVLHSANLKRADLVFVNFNRVILVNATLTGANLARANLMDADLARADLSAANLKGALLNGANLTGAMLGSTVLADLDLSEAIGLETVKHVAPSSIGLDTFYRSKGKVPEAFLRGAGVPDTFIRYAASLSRAAFDFYSCFISYSTKDDVFVQRLYADLQAKGVRCWFAPEDLKIGSKFRVDIDQAIQIHDKLLLVLSEHSVQSDWVEKEVETAFERERREKRLVLFPVCLGDALKRVTAGWAADIRRNRHMGDFRNWLDENAYAKAFGRLLRDLKSEKAKAA